VENVHVKDIYGFNRHVTEYFNDKNSECEENRTIRAVIWQTPHESKQLSAGAVWDFAFGTAVVAPFVAVTG
jgi:hypothetical protein